MMRLSVNLNRVALLRNSRDIGIPDLMEAADTCVAAGAQGITVHPRPDERHIRPSDVSQLADRLSVELNVEGNPFPEFMTLVGKVRPTQCTLVPDSPEQATSDHGWTLLDGAELSADARSLAPKVAKLTDLGIRVSLFMDPDPEQMEAAREIGAQRIELYTESYARAFGGAQQAEVLERFARAAARAQELGLGVNAGHDLNLQNLPLFASIPGILEVSIGHALCSDALYMGLGDAVRAYLTVISSV